MHINWKLKVKQAPRLLLEHCLWPHHRPKAEQITLKNIVYSYMLQNKCSIRYLEHGDYRLRYSPTFCSSFHRQVIFTLSVPVVGHMTGEGSHLFIRSSLLIELKKYSQKLSRVNEQKLTRLKAKQHNY